MTATSKSKTDVRAGCCDSEHNKMTLTALLEFPMLKMITAADDNFCGDFRRGRTDISLTMSLPFSH